MKTFGFSPEVYHLCRTDPSDPNKQVISEEMKEVLLTNFMVPLPSKVYMDAYLAINQSKFLLGHFAPDGSVVRTYLASSRSLRDHVTASKVMPNEDKQILLDIPFPRFVWVTEFGTIDEYNHAVNSGIIVLDATEPTDRSTNPLIMAINGDRGVIYNMEQNRFDNLNLPENLIIEKYDKNIN